MNTNILQKYLSACLNQAAGCDMLTLDSVLHQMPMSNKIESIREMHPYAITPPPKEGGRWQTAYKDASGKKHNIKAPTKEALIDKLIVIYASGKHLDKMTFYELYLEWLEYKRNLVGSSNTIRRYEQRYLKYFGNSIFSKKKLNQIDSILLETECNRIVRENNLSRKEWVNAKTILNGMYEYALRKKYIEKNPLSEVQMQVKYRQVIKKTGKTQTYNRNELSHLNQYLDRMYTETGDTAFLAVRINFLLGLRVGELTALKWSDWDGKRTLHVVREEIRDQERNTYSVVEHTKTHCDRFVAVPPKAIEIFKQIPEQGKYIFIRNGERLTSRQIAYVLEKYAKLQGTPTKSTHKMRKTYASNLAANGVPLDAIREMLGHSELTTTLGYIYNPLPEEETYQLISKAL